MPRRTSLLKRTRAIAVHLRLPNLSCTWAETFREVSEATELGVFGLDLLEDGNVDVWQTRENADPSSPEMTEPTHRQKFSSNQIIGLESLLVKCQADL